MANKTSQHILGTSANLLGFCLVVLTSIHLNDKSDSTIIDETTSIVAILLVVSSLLSFLSIRTELTKIEQRFENTANILFLTSLIGILCIISLVLFQFMDYK